MFLGINRAKEKSKLDCLFHRILESAKRKEVAETFLDVFVINPPLLSLGHLKLPCRSQEQNVFSPRLLFNDSTFFILLSFVHGGVCV